MNARPASIEVLLPGAPCTADGGLEVWEATWGPVPRQRKMAIESNLMLLFTILVIVVVGVLLLYLIDWFVWNLRLANVLKTLVALICLAAILRRLLPALGVGL